MFRMLNDVEKQYLRSNIENTLQEMQDYANNVSIKRLGFNDHGPVHMRQVASNSIKMLNIFYHLL